MIKGALLDVIRAASSATALPSLNTSYARPSRSIGFYENLRQSNYKLPRLSLGGTEAPGVQSSDKRHLRAVPLGRGL